MLKALDHKYSVTMSVTFVNCKKSNVSLFAFVLQDDSSREWSNVHDLRPSRMLSRGIARMINLAGVSGTTGPVSALSVIDGFFRQMPATKSEKEEKVGGLIMWLALLKTGFPIAMQSCPDAPGQ